jgi:hypothetical protein
VMAAKARSAGRGNNLPTRDTIAQIVPPALLTQTSRSIMCADCLHVNIRRLLMLLYCEVTVCCCRYRLVARKAVKSEQAAAET